MSSRRPRRPRSQGRTGRDRPGDPAQLPEEHPPRPAERGARRPSAARTAATPSVDRGRDQRRRRDPGGRGADRERPRRAAGRDRVHGRRRLRCGTSGSSCGPRCEACWSRRRSRTWSSVAGRRGTRDQASARAAPPARRRPGPAGPRTQTICPRSSSSFLEPVACRLPGDVARRRRPTPRPGRRTRSASPGPPIASTPAGTGPARLARSCGRTQRSPNRLASPTKLHHELRSPARRRAASGADLLDRACVHDRDLAGDVHRLGLIVRDEEVPSSRAPPRAGGRSHRELRADAGVERAERLVEQQHLRLRARAPARAPSADAGRPSAATDSGGQRLELHELRRLVDAIADLGLRSLPDWSPKATLSRTVMCLKAA